MEVGKNNFDFIAGSYDVLAKLVFGNTIRRAQQSSLDVARHSHDILIIGGGTGWLLADVLKINPTAHIWYVEASRKMIDQARRRCTMVTDHQVKFIHGTEEHLPTNGAFDLVIANFYFDMFTEDLLPEVIRRISASMKADSTLLATDFVHPKTVWQSILLKVMYMFFRTVSRLEGTTLPPWKRLLRENGFSEASVEEFSNGFIAACVYKLR